MKRKNEDELIAEEDLAAAELDVIEVLRKRLDGNPFASADVLGGALRVILVDVDEGEIDEVMECFDEGLEGPGEDDEEEGDDVDEGEIDEEEIAELGELEPDVMGNPPAWVKSKRIWRRAKDAVDPEGRGARYRKPWAVVAHVYKQMGGQVR